MDPLSVISGVAGVISFGIQVAQTLIDFYNDYKDRDARIAKMLQRLDGLLQLFNSLETILSERDMSKETLAVETSIKESITACEEIIVDLQAQCKSFQKLPTSSLGQAFRKTGHRLAYPFRKGTLENLDEDIEVIRENIAFALNILQMNDNHRFTANLRDQKSLLESIKAMQLSSETREWLQAPDASVNYNSALSKAHPGTGLWFLNGKEFDEWLLAENSFLWIYGFAGCGKSVLLSSIVQATHSRAKSRSNVAIAFFFFSFSDKSKQDENTMLRALLLQLSGQTSGQCSGLERLYNAYRPGSPPTYELLQTLHIIVSEFDDVYLFFEALDEAAHGTSQEKVLEVVNAIREWNLDQIHLMVTSRDDANIRDALDCDDLRTITMRNSGIDQDISNFIKSQLQTNKKLHKKWSGHQNKIGDELTARAKGV